ncbi:hypothetical protein EHYA_07347 [Embleya hyalina]|uniref:Uncharacterized protein n=1 Tax=Embleya hyalina TaxID=516124 RepID=A0A401YYQ4_9ACTN|nr:hypothetical protein EHYA_07347 [Embleya hyalina]
MQAGAGSRWDDRTRQRRALVPMGRRKRATPVHIPTRPLASCGARAVSRARPQLSPRQEEQEVEGEHQAQPAEGGHERHHHPPGADPWEQQNALGIVAAKRDRHLSVLPHASERRQFHRTHPYAVPPGRTPRAPTPRRRRPAFRPCSSGPTHRSAYSAAEHHRPHVRERGRGAVVAVPVAPGARRNVDSDGTGSGNGTAASGAPPGSDVPLGGEAGDAGGARSPAVVPGPAGDRTGSDEEFAVDRTNVAAAGVRGGGGGGCRGGICGRRHTVRSETFGRGSVVGLGIRSHRRCRKSRNRVCSVPIVVL